VLLGDRGVEKNELGRGRGHLYNFVYECRV